MSADKDKDVERKIAIIGLGYVGLPLAVDFSKKFEVIGFDTNEKRIRELKRGFDATRELTENKLLHNDELNFTSNIKEIAGLYLFKINFETIN